MPASLDLDSTEDGCWICLGRDGALTRPCACNLACHALCLARWQLHKSGTREEHTCRFCAHPLPDWRAALTPLPADRLHAVTSNVSVHLGDQVLVMRVHNSEAGRQQFLRRLQELTGAPLDAGNVSFVCKVDGQGAEPEEQLLLHGLATFQQAMDCAAYMAARRQAAGGGVGGEGDGDGADVAGGRADERRGGCALPAATNSDDSSVEGSSVEGSSVEGSPGRLDASAASGVGGGSGVAPAPPSTALRCSPRGWDGVVGAASAVWRRVVPSWGLHGR